MHTGPSVDRCLNRLAARDRKPSIHNRLPLERSVAQWTLMAALHARLEVRITPDDIGARITVRARHHGPDASAVDVVGVLRDWRDGQLQITRRNGSTTIVTEEDLLAARVVPQPPPPRRARTTPQHDDHL